jgi:hypothetical protein
MTRRGGVGKGTGSKGCRGEEHGQACTKERSGAVAVRAALESAVQVGRGNEGNRQAEMANPTKCRDSLQEASLKRDASRLLVTDRICARARYTSEAPRRLLLDFELHMGCKSGTGTAAGFSLDAFFMLRIRHAVVCGAFHPPAVAVRRTGSATNRTINHLDREECV